MRRWNSRLFHASILTVVGCLLVAPELHAATSAFHQVVAFQNQTPPAGTPGERFLSFTYSAVNESGDVAFHGTSIGGTVSSQDGLYVAEVLGPLRSVVRRGDPAPGVPGAVFDLLGNRPYLDDSGGVGFTATLLRGTGGVTFDDDRGVWGPGADGAPVLLVREGQGAAGVMGTFGGSASHVGVLGPAGLAFSDHVLGADGVLLGHGYWRVLADASGVSQELVLFEGDPMPGGPPGAVLTGTARPHMKALGQIAIRAAYSVEGGATRYGIWGPGAEGELAPLALPGDPIQDAPPGTTYPSLVSAHPRVNGRGEVAFSFGNRVIGPDGAGGLRLVAGGGQEVPGLPGLEISAADPPNLNDAAEITFRALLFDAATNEPLAPESEGAIFGPDGAGGVRLVARTGDAVPGVPDLVMRNFSWPVINGLGDVAFTATLFDGAGPEATAAGQAVFLATKAGHLVPVLRSGEVVVVGPGDSRMVVAPRIADGLNTPDSARALNDRRQLAIWTTSLVLRSSVAIPECQNGLDDDGDGGIDWDGGAAYHAGVAMAEPDDHCAGDPGGREAAGCGLGLELALLWPLVACLRRRTEAADPSGSDPS